MTAHMNQRVLAREALERLVTDASHGQRSVDDVKADATRIRTVFDLFSIVEQAHRELLAAIAPNVTRIQETEARRERFKRDFPGEDIGPYDRAVTSAWNSLARDVVRVVEGAI